MSGAVTARVAVLSFAALLLASIGIAGCADAGTGGDETASVESEPSASSDPDWSPYFADTTMVTDKPDYVHVFWNAYGAREHLAEGDRSGRLGRAAVQLALSQVAGSTDKDSFKVDIVYVSEKDNYGKPRWDSLKKVAHLEFSLAAVKQRSTISADRVSTLR